jgi:hypothetical protein
MIMLMVPQPSIGSTVCRCGEIGSTRDVRLSVNGLAGLLAAVGLAAERNSLLRSN